MNIQYTKHEIVVSTSKCVVFQVERSVALLNSLASEKQRWETGSETFKNQMATIIGDVLLSSAFMAYGGKYMMFVSL